MEADRDSRDVTKLQDLVLTSALTGQPLPGTGTIMVPELAQIVARERVFVLDENLSPSIARHIGSKSLVIVDRSQLAQPAGTGGDIMYLSFGPVELRGDLALVRLDVSVQGTIGSRSLGGAVFEFERTQGQWVAKPPNTFAT